MGSVVAIDVVLVATIFVCLSFVRGVDVRVVLIQDWEEFGPWNSLLNELAILLGNVLREMGRVFR